MIDISKSKYEIFSETPAVLIEETEEKYNFALLGNGISIDKNFIYDVIRTIEDKGYLIPAKYRLILQILKIGDIIVSG